MTVYTVWFRNERGKAISKTFDSPYKAWVFAEKLKRSKTCRLLVSPRTE